jgi:hypothetical protein
MSFWRCFVFKARESVGEYQSKPSYRPSPRIATALCTCHFRPFSCDIPRASQISAVERAPFCRIASLPIHTQVRVTKLIPLKYSICCVLLSKISESSSGRSHILLSVHALQQGRLHVCCYHYCHHCLFLHRESIHPGGEKKKKKKGQKGLGSACLSLV